MSQSKPATRSATEIYLLGFTNASINGTRLPSRKYPSVENKQKNRARKFGHYY